MAHAALLAALVLSMRAVRVAIAARVGPALPCPRSAHEFPARRLATHRGLPNEPELAGSGAGGARWAAVRLSPPAARRLEELAAAADTLDPLILEAAGSEAHTHIAEAWPGAALHRPVQPAAGESHGRPGGARQLAEYEYMTNTTELPRLRAIDESCRRLVVVWCAAKQGGDGISVYDTYLKVSILSALDKAPHVVPVLLFDGAADHPLAAWVREKGGIVIIHSLSFKEKMMAAATELYRWQTTTWLATFSYFDLGLATVANQLRLLTAGRGVDLTNVLYIDVDTIFMGDMNSCSLPSPRILSAAGEATKLSPANAGVVYINLTAWQEINSDLMHFGELSGWMFPNVDQTWLFRFFGDRVSVLPDTYNWKPYWGYPEAGAWGDAPAVRIIHIHGPKFQESLCVLKYLGVNNLTDASNTTLLTKIKDLCNYKRNQYSMQLLLDANKVDGGRMYSDAHRTFFQYLAQIRSISHSDDYWDLYNGNHGSKTLKASVDPGQRLSVPKLPPASRN